MGWKMKKEGKGIEKEGKGEEKVWKDMWTGSYFPSLKTR